MYLNSGRKEECCGCTACKAACPKQCIKMVEDCEGFTYPVVDRETCISCGRCEQVCPFNIEILDGKCNDCYYGWLNDDMSRIKSTSGGAFFAIADAALKKGITHIYGAAYDEELKVHHICVDSSSDLDKLRRSKYVQSDMDGVFSEILSSLKLGKKVLFSGTPCQVQGLLNLIPESLKENLYTISLVCHGVSSPKVFKKYLNEIENKHTCKVSDVTFRDKQIIDGKLTHKCTTITLANGKQLKSTEDPYTIAFGTGLITRLSCFNCPFSTPYRKMDVTIGDFWGIEKHIPALNEFVSNGISLILTHTQKGDEIVNEIREYFKLESVDLEWAVNPRQQQLIHPAIKPSRRDSFMKSIDKDKNFIQKARIELLRYKVMRSIKVRLGSAIKAFHKD